MGMASPDWCAATSSLVKKGLPRPARHHLVDECARRGPSEQRRHALGNLVRLQPTQLDSMSGRESCELGKPTPMARVVGDLVRTVGPHQHHLLVDQVASQVLEQIPRHRVGPVQVFEPDDHCISVQPRDQLENGDEQPAVR